MVPVLWYVCAILFLAECGQPVLGAPKEAGVKPQHERLGRHPAPQGRRPMAKKIPKPSSNQYSPAHWNSVAKWDNIDHLVFNDKCISCNNWVYGGGKAVVFLHMRKAGGTLFLRLLQEWFLHQECVTMENRGNRVAGCPVNTEKGKICEQSTAFGGVHNGIYYTYKKEAIKVAPHCHNIEFRHYEYSCLHGPSIEILPPLLERPPAHFSLFTILRNPIERHASQFFFVGPGEKYVNRRNMDMCHSSNSTETSDCVRVARTTSRCAACLKRSTDLALSELEQNEDVWLSWMRNSEDYGFGERYMPNYYVHRISSGANPSPRRTVDAQEALNCFKNNSTRCKGDSIDVLSNIALAEYCHHSDRNMTESLKLSKKLLAEQFDFLILEAIKQDRHITAEVIGKIFDTNYAKSISSKDEKKSLNKKPQPGLMRRTNRSIDTTSGYYYQDKMPPAVLQLMKEQNDLDIELYDFAVSLFRQRHCRGNCLG